MLKNILVLATTIFISTSFAANKAEKHADAKSKKTDKAAATETLTVDTSASTIDWTGSKKVGESKHNGKVQIKDGKIEMKKGKITGGNFTIDMATISNEDLKDKPDYQAKLVNHLKSDDFFKVDANPTSEFKITSVKEKDGKTWIVGKLKMLAKEETVEFPAVVENKDGVHTAKAEFSIDRTKWGLTYGSGNIFKELSVDKVINNNIDFKLNIVAKK